MTNDLAKEIFDTLIEQIRENGFADILTFSLRETEGDNQFSKFSDSYLYESTEAELQNLINLSDNSDLGATTALKTLLRAGQIYFETLKSIPSQYTEQINELSSQRENRIDTQIVLLTGQKQRNLNSILQNESVGSVQRLFDFISEHLRDDDGIFLSRLNAFLKELQ